MSPARAPVYPRAMDAASPPRLALALATRDGAGWLGAQLDSIAAQTLPPDLVLAGDDGSTDATPDILDAFGAAHPALGLTRVPGPRQGSAANFISLLARLPEGTRHAAFADQDDVWLPGKLARAVDRLAAEGRGRDGPVLYCARVTICDDALRPRGATRLPARPMGFGNALAQNVASGNTIVLNAAATAIAREAAARIVATGAWPVVHDWWLYQLVTGAGGRAVFDPEPQLMYRQHAGNLIGANAGVLARARRLRHLWVGTYRSWNETNLAALSAAEHLLTPRNAARLRAFRRARARKGVAAAPARLAALRGLGLYRQGRRGQTSLYAAALMGKL